jgi:hypothetical protein
MTGRVRINQVNAPIKKVHKNTEQEIIVITSDRLELVLQKHLKYLERRKEWIAPLGLLLAIVTTFCTATFKNAFFSADTWKAIFVMAGVVSLVWLIKSGWASFRSPDIGEVMNKIKQNSDTQTNIQIQKAGADPGS